MVAEKKPAGSGNGFLDIAARMRTPRLMRPVAVQPASGVQGVAPEKNNPLDDMAALRERLLATRATEVLIDEQEADLELRRADTSARRAEARLMTAEAEDKIQVLAEKRNGSSGNETTMMLIELLRERQVPKQDDQLAAVLMQVAQSVGDLRTEILGRMMTKEEPQADFADRVAEVVNLKAAMDALFPTQKPAEVTAASSDINTMLMMSRLEHDHALRMLEIDERKQQRLDDQKLEERRAEIAAERTNTLGNMFSRALEQVGPLVQEVLAKKTSPIMPVGAMPMVDPTTLINYPPVTPIRADVTNLAPIHAFGVAEHPGVTPPSHTDLSKIDIQEPCPHCHSLISFPQGTSEFKCPKCGNGIEVEYTPDEIAAMSQAGS